MTTTITTGTACMPASARLAADRHDAVTTLVLHLAPGVAFVAAAWLLGRLAATQGLPPAAGLMAATVLVLIPIQLGIIAAVARRRTGSWRLQGALGYTRRLPVRVLVGLGMATLAWAGLAFTVTAPVGEALRASLFAWWPAELDYTAHLAAPGRLLDEFPDARWLQGVANELHQAETAFLTPGQPGEFRLRWFTPVAEVALCGHATLASTHRLWETGVLDQDAVATFVTGSGRLTAVRDGDRVVLDFPAVPATQVTPSPQLLAALAGAVPVWVGVTDHPDAGERNLLAVLESEEAVRTLIPDLREVTRLPVGGLIVTAKRRDGGVVSRYFAPVYGIPEDPVTGSAHCTIAPYWREELGATLSAEQASPRGGELTVTSTDAGRVHLAGRARTAATGYLH